MSKTKTYPAKDEVPQMVDKIAAMKSYERARADVEAGRVVEFESLESLKEYYDRL